MAPSPYINHFIQPDTIIPNPANPQSFNRYSYVQNNPVRYNDPTGHTMDCAPNDFQCNNSDDFRISPEYILKKFNVTVDSRFTANEKNAIVHAVIKVAYRFADERERDESGADAFVAIYDNVTFRKEGGPGTCAGDPVASGGCTDGAHQIRFWSMTGHMYNEIDRMVLNVVHELGHAFDWTHYDYDTLTRPSNYMSPDYTRDALLRPNPEDPGRWYWQQSDRNTNNEIFGDMFIAWTYNAWNTTSDPLTVTAINRARDWITGLVRTP